MLIFQKPKNIQSLNWILLVLIKKKCNAFNKDTFVLAKATPVDNKHFNNNVSEASEGISALQGPSIVDLVKICVNLHGRLFTVSSFAVSSLRKITAEDTKGDTIKNSTGISNKACINQENTKLKFAKQSDKVFSDHIIAVKGSIGD